MRVSTVILRRDVPGLGRVGDVKSVAAGYARNYLLPNGLAMVSTPSAVKLVEEERRRGGRERAKALEEAKLLAKKLGTVSLTIRRSAGDEGKLFGSVTAGDVAEALVQEGIRIEKRAVTLEEPIKVLGVYHVTIHLEQDCETTVKVWVVQE